MTRAEILDQAKKCVCGDRDEQYGSPENNFQLIADLWNRYLKYKGEITAEDVAAMMVLFKIARVRTGVGTDDSFVDICGYAACGGEIHGLKNEAFRTRFLGEPYKSCANCNHCGKSRSYEYPCNSCRDVEHPENDYKNWESKGEDSSCEWCAHRGNISKCSHCKRHGNGAATDDNFRYWNQDKSGWKGEEENGN